MGKLTDPLIQFLPGKIRRAQVQQNDNDLRAAINTAMFTDEAVTVTVGHTFTPSQTFAGGADFGAAPLPKVSLGAALGSAAKRWSALYAQTGDFSGDVSISGANRTLTIDDGGVGSGVAVSLMTNKGLPAQKSAALSLGTDGHVRLSGGALLFGTGVTNGASDGDIIIAVQKAIRSANASGTNTQAMIALDSFNQVQLGANDGSTVASLVKLGGFAAASIPAAASARSGSIGFDTTNGRIIYYIGTNRYYLTGTAF